MYLHDLKLFSGQAFWELPYGINHEWDAWRLGGWISAAREKATHPPKYDWVPESVRMRPEAGLH
jgi:hypothetical protein